MSPKNEGENDGTPVPAKKPKLDVTSAKTPLGKASGVKTPASGTPSNRLVDHHRLFRSMALKIKSGKLKATEINDILDRSFNSVALFAEDEALLDAFLNAPWSSADSENFDFPRYEKFVLAVLMKETDHLEKMLHVWIRALLDETRKDFYDRIHRTIAAFNNVFPATQDKLIKVICRNLSFLKTQGAAVTVSFTVQMLRISAYLPQIAGDLMDLVVRNIAAVDVRLPENAISETFVDEADTEEEKAAALATHAKAESLDQATEILIRELLRRLQAHRKEKPSEDEKVVLEQLLSVAGPVFLSCETTTHIQFVLFVLSAASEDCAQYLLDWLWDCIRNPRSQPAVREVALGYMASFLCRAVFLNLEQKQTCVQMLCRWVNAYINQGPHGTAEFKSHLPFYAMCQAIFYVFAFNHKQFMKKKSGLAWAKQLGLERIVGSSLNPLKYCQPDVVKNFANVSRHYQIVYCYSIIERNKRTFVPDLEWTSNGELCPVSRTYLNPIFPFDKPLMPRCRKLVEPFYVEYDESNNVPVPSLLIENQASIANFCAPEPQQNRRERRDTTGSLGADMFDYSSSPGFIQW